MKRSKRPGKGGAAYWEKMMAHKTYLANMGFLNAICRKPMAFRLRLGWQIIRGKEFEV